MIQTYPGCESCPLRDQPAVLGFGPSRAQYMIIGEAPGRQEVVKGLPFVGQSGNLLRQVVSMIGIDPDSIYITNSALCHPEDNATPNAASLKCCRQRLFDEIRRVSPEKILLLGSVPLLTVLNEKSITKVHGLGFSIEIEEGDPPIYVLPTFHPAAILRNPDFFRDFRVDLVKFFDPLRTQPEEICHHYSVVETREEGLEILNEFMGASLLSCDLETTGLNPQTDEILSIGFGGMTRDDVGVSAIFPRGVSDLCRREITQFIRDFPGNLVFHNFKFDLKFLRRWSGDPDLTPQHIRDTMLMAYAQDERGVADERTSAYSKPSHGLKTQAQLRFDIPDYHFDWKKFYSTPNADRDYNALFEYHSLDCYSTVRLYPELHRELDLESTNLNPLVDNLLIPASLALSKMETRGALIDRPYLEEKRVELEQKVTPLAEKLITLAKFEGAELENPNSAPQVRKVLDKLGFPRGISEREEYLFEIKKPEYSEVCKDFVLTLLEYRQWARLLSTYVVGILERLDSSNRVHPDFLVNGADTGRLSCQDPNLQNIPTLIGKVIRNAFIAPKGYAFVNADYSQLELRVAAWFSKDENLIRAFNEDKDIHRWVASLIFGKPEEEITKLERYLAKYFDFGIVYGRGAEGIATGWEAEYIVEQGGDRLTVRDAEKLRQTFLGSFPGLDEYIKSQHKLVRQQHYIETPTGRRRRFPYLTWQTVGRAERQSVNSPIQGFASDMTLMSMIRLDKMLPEGAEMFSTVHDSIMFYVREDLLDEVVPRIRDVMSIPCIPEFDVPLKVDVSVGVGENACWGKLQEE